MKTLIPAAIRCSLMFTAALLLVYPASVQAVPTTYQYTGNHFTFATPPYTTSDFVTAMVTLAGPLGANMPLTEVTPTAFIMTDGVQTISNLTTINAVFRFATDATGSITEWDVFAGNPFPPPNPIPRIQTRRFGGDQILDVGTIETGAQGYNFGMPGEWTLRASVPDAGSTLSLMTLTLMALGLVARQFQRAAA